MTRAVVIGAGISGLVAAIRLARGGARVTLVAKGTGGLQLSQGTIDILGYAPERVTRPLEALAGYAADRPGHPYARLDVGLVASSVRWVRDLLPGLLVGEPDQNLQLPTAVGAIRPTALASPSMVAGACVADARFVIAGLRQLKDFYPQLVAENLSRTELPGGGRLRARPVILDFPDRFGEADSTGLGYARSFDDPDYRRRFAAALKPLLDEGETVGLPAVLGLDDHRAWADVAELLGQPVFEIPLPPPSVPGMRLNRALTAIAKQDGVRIIVGSPVTGCLSDGGRIVSVATAAAGSPRSYSGDVFVYAPGGFESGALALDSYGVVTETALGLPLVGADHPELVHGDYWGPDQPLFEVGVAVDDAMRVEGFDNLYAAGGILPGATRWREKSGEGIGIASAVLAADTILGRHAAEPKEQAS